MRMALCQLGKPCRGDGVVSQSCLLARGHVGGGLLIGAVDIELLQVRIETTRSMGGSGFNGNLDRYWT